MYLHVRGARSRDCSSGSIVKMPVSTIIPGIPVELVYFAADVHQVISTGKSGLLIWIRNGIVAKVGPPAPFRVKQRQS